MRSQFFCALILSLACFYGQAAEVVEVPPAEVPLFIPIRQKVNGLYAADDVPKPKDKDAELLIKDGELSSVIATKEEEEKAAISAASVAAENQASIVETIRNNIPNAVESALLWRAQQLIDEKENGSLALCNKTKHLPTSVRADLIKCAKDQNARGIQIANKTLQGLADTRDLFSRTKAKFKECQLKKDEYIQKKLNESLVATTTQKPKRLKPTRQTNAGRVIDAGKKVISKIAELAKATIEFFNKNGCFILATGELALNGTMIAVDMILNGIEAADFVQNVDLTVKKCISDKFDDFMVKECNDQYIPKFGDKK